ncbi:MAG: response regulator [Myxococcota bacterium]|nr:response regulator [Myxococcota bacterium]
MEVPRTRFLEIAIVEDCLSDLEFIQSVIDDDVMVLQEFHFSLRGFRSGEALLDYMDKGYTPSICFLGIGLPGLSGIELATQLRQFSENIQFIFISHQLDFPFDATFNVLGENFTYYTKPISYFEIKSALYSAASSWKARELDTVLADEIAERNRIEESLKLANEKARAANRLKSQFLANMSHEIRTPMNGVIGMTQLLLRTSLSEKQKRYAQTVQRSGEALLTIIDDILDFSKIEAGKLELHEVNFQIQHTISDLIILLSPQAKHKGIGLTASIEASVPQTLRGDPGRLRQILTNLIGNALKFTSEGKVEIRISVQEETTDSITLYGEIQDTGIGISEAGQKDLFRSFNQADGSSNRKFGGTGLGLAISKQIVQLMGGEIGVRSILGEGTTVWFTIKLMPPPEDQPEEAQSSVALRNKRLYIIDDSQIIHETLHGILAPHEIKMTFSESGREGIEQIMTQAREGIFYDFIIIDWYMPGLDGFEVIRQLRSFECYHSTPIIMLTAFPQRGHGQQCKHTGVNAYLQKPIRENEILKCLKTLVADEIQPPNSELVTRHSLAESGVHIQQTSPQSQKVEISKTTQENAETTSQTKILVAEDNPVNQEVIRGILEELDYSPEIVANGKECIAACKQDSYALILMDCMMPEMNGYEAAMAIREQDSEFQEIPIVALTAKAMPGDQELVLNSGMNDYLTKPVTLNKLETTIKKWLNESRPE